MGSPYLTNFKRVNRAGVTQNGLEIGDNLIVKINKSLWSTGVLAQRQGDGSWKTKLVDQAGQNDKLKFTLKEYKKINGVRTLVNYPAGEYRLIVRWQVGKFGVQGITDEFVIA